MAINSYNYDWWSYDKDLMLDFNHFLKKINNRAAIQQGFTNDQYENLNRHGVIDHGLGENVEYFHPTITLDDRMRFIGTEIATSRMSDTNIVGNTIISHFYGARGVHWVVSGKEGTFVDFDRIADGDADYIKSLRNNIDKAIKNKQPIWGTTELHTSIQTAGRNYCRKKYNDPDRKFHPVDVSEWVASFRDSKIIEGMLAAKDLFEVFTLLRTLPGVGEYYGFHCATSTSVLPQMKYHHDQRFVAPGPGAVYTIKLLWPDVPNKYLAEAIYFIRENAAEIGLTKDVIFHESAYNIELDNGSHLFKEQQNSLKYYGTEVLCCQFGVYLQIRDDEKACGRRQVARAKTPQNTLTEFF